MLAFPAPNPGSTSYLATSYYHRTLHYINAFKFNNHSVTPLRNTGVSHVSSFGDLGMPRCDPAPYLRPPSPATLARQVCALPAKHRSVEWSMMDSATLQYEKHVHLAAAKTVKLACSAGYQTVVMHVRYTSLSRAPGLHATR